MDSIWSEVSKNDGFPQLRGNLKTDVVIVGGGLAGVLCLKELTDRGVDCILLEAKSIGSGITKNTTAKITFQHGLIYDKLIKNVGLEKAKQYLTANKNALEKFKKMAEEFPCDFEEKDAFVYSATDRIKIENEIKAYEKLGISAEFVSSIPLPVECIGAVKVKNQAQFNPLQFLAEIAKGLNIYEHTKVRELAPNTAITEHGKITASKIIVTTHFPFLNKHGSYFLKMYQHRSYVIAYKNAPDVNGMYVDEALKGVSFRNYKDLLLIGGGDHRTGKKGGNWQEISTFAARHYPTVKEVYRWATQDCMTLDEIPYIGQYSGRTSSLYVATGFNKWGMTSAMVAAMILRDMVIEKENPYAPVFSPSRTILRPQLLINAFEATTNLLTPTTKRCPHLGCALKWNPAEHSWDCPCHGSRFTHDGQLIDNPSTDDLK